jgi:hypothetical protein
VCIESVRGLDNYYNTCSQLQQHFASSEPCCVPQWLDEDDEDNSPAAAEDMTSIEDLEDDSIQLFDSIKGQHHDRETLLLKILSAMNLHFADSEEGNSLPVAIDLGLQSQVTELEK